MQCTPNSSWAYNQVNWLKRPLMEIKCLNAFNVSDNYYIVRGSDQLESLSYFGHCAHFPLLVIV